MRCSLPLEVTSRLLILVANGTLIISGQLNALLTTLSLSAIALSFVLLSLGKGLEPASRFWNAMTVLAFLAFIPDLLWIADTALDAAVRLLLYLMAYRLFHLDGPRAHLQLALIAFLQILAGTQYSAGLFLGICFLLFLIVGVWTLILIHLQEAQATGPREERQITPLFFAITTTLSITAFFFTLAVFFIIPRVSAGLFSGQESDPINVAGFSERVDFGSIGPIKLKTSVVMRVMVPDRQATASLPLYLRGMAFDRYDGLSWSRRKSSRREIHRSPAGTFRIGQPERSGSHISQRILLEPLGTHVLFGFSRLTMIGGPMASISVDEHDSVYAPSIPTSRVVYTADSRPSFVSTADLNAKSLTYPTRILKTYLHRPEENQKILNLAREVTQDAETVYEKVKAIESHLREGYRYSLEVEGTPGRSPIDDFLFGRKAGYCEHFATAMVIMLRELEIPSRLVTGFLPGEWNEYGGYYMVRQSDAHAWVEAYFPQSGWITFDPTPSQPFPSTPWLAGFTHYVDHLKIHWERYIINYSPMDQAEALSNVKDQTDSLLNRLQQAGMIAMRGLTTVVRMVQDWTLQRWLLFSVGFAVCMMLFFALRNAQSFSKSQLPIRRQDDPATQLYSLMLKILESKGHAKQNHLTPIEFLKSLVLSDQDLEHVREITQTYCRSRFGGKSMTLDERKRLESLLETLIEARASING